MKIMEQDLTTYSTGNAHGFQFCWTLFMLCYVDLHSCILVSQFRFEINKCSLNPIQEVT